MPVDSTTPMQRQYNELKAAYPEAMLFFRLGDFYEMFGDDAVEAAKILGITLTSRDRNSDNPLPMCGVPYHAAENYLAKLTKAGKRVAIAEQVSDPKLPGLTKREVVRVITPGTTFSEQVLEAKEHQFLAALAEREKIFAVAVADLSTGDFFVLENLTAQDAESELRRFQVKELVLNAEVFAGNFWQQVFPVVTKQQSAKNPREHLLEHFGTKTLKGFGIEEHGAAIEAASLLLKYLEETQKGSVPHLRSVRLENTQDFMTLSPETIRHLELFADAEGKKEGSLVEILDETKTAMGGRKLRSIVLRPLKNQKEIEERLDAVEELMEKPEVLEKLKNELKEVADLERLIAKISCGRANPRDLVALRESLKRLPEIAQHLEKLNAKKISSFLKLIKG